MWCTPDFVQSFALLSMLDAENGSTVHSNEASWFAVNGVEGGAANLLTRISNPWSYGSEDAILDFLLLDPTKPAASDPRPTYPTVFYDQPAGRILAHSDWTANGTFFNYRASWNSIDHQQDDAGMFELYRNGEWLTKGMSNYDSNYVGQSSTFHSTLALQNWCSAGIPNLNWFETGEWTYGSQWMLGLNAGDPTTVASSGAGYVYAASDLTNLYNRPNPWTPSVSATNVTQATRSILWLNKDYIVVYDRATTLSAGLFKQFNLSLVTNPTIIGNVATETMPDGQQLFIQTLLPAHPTITSVYAAGIPNPVAILEPTQYILRVQDATLPANTRFLHVLQGANKGVGVAAATYLQSISGTAFDGAAFGSSVVYFPVTTNSGMTTTTFGAPGSATNMYIAGLTPGSAYAVQLSVNAGGYLVQLTPGGTGYTADTAGVLTVGL